jgi:hypothetical protein
MRNGTAVVSCMLWALVHPAMGAPVQAGTAENWIPYEFGSDLTRGCSVINQISPTFALILTSTIDNDGLSLFLRDETWSLSPSDTVPLTVAFERYESAFEAVVQTKNLAVLSFGETSNAGDSSNFIYATRLQITLETDQRTIELPSFSQVTTSVLECVESRTAQFAPPQPEQGNYSLPSSEQFQSGLQEMAEVPVAAFACAIAVTDIAGVIDTTGRDYPQQTELMLYADGSLRIKGTKIPSAPLQDASNASTAGTTVYDAAAVLRAWKGSAPLPHLLGEDNEGMNQALQMFGQLSTDMLLAGRKRLLVVALGSDLVAFTDVDQAGNLNNMSKPACYRTR